MSEIRNTFVKSKMNKDLDDRLLSKGEYRNALNVQVSRSEGEDVGALENALGNIFIGDWGLGNIPNLEIIGYAKDDSLQKVFFIATNYTDTSPNKRDNGAPFGASCFILLFDNLSDNKFKILVQGRFLNFSKTHPVYGMDVLEDLLFWTDNRNQPRKINWRKALEDSNYYYNEDQISVAKYYPCKAPFLVKQVSVKLGDFNGEGNGPIVGEPTISDIDKYEAQNVGSFGLAIEGSDIVNLRPGMTLTYPKPKKQIYFDYAGGSQAGGEFAEYDVDCYITEINYSRSYIVLSIEPDQTTFITGDTLIFTEGTSTSVTEKFLPSKTLIQLIDSRPDETNGGFIVTYKVGDYNQIRDNRGNPCGNTNTTLENVDCSFSVVGNPWNPLGVNSQLYNKAFAGEEILLTSNQQKIFDPLTAGTTQTGRYNYYRFEVRTDKDPFEYLPSLPDNLSSRNNEGWWCEVRERNPHYISSWSGDKDYLRDKFVRFAYRFRFDDGEYSVISPFTQPAFIPKQGGYLNTKVPQLDTPTRGVNNLNYDGIGIQNSTIVSFFENSVQNVDIYFETPYIVSELEEKLKVKAIDIIYKESDGLAYRVLKTIESSQDEVTTNDTNFFVYTYNSSKPFRTLPEKESTRVFDKVPVRALTQSIVGNRVVYGNFIDKHSPPESLDYNVAISPKFRSSAVLSNASNELVKITELTREEYPTHSVKQNRSYQVGIILADRYGRQTDVILSPITPFEFFINQAQENINTIRFAESTVFHPFRNNGPYALGNPANPWYYTINSGEATKDQQRFYDTRSEFPWNWFGDSLKVLFRNIIPEDKKENGYPGVYKEGTYSYKASYVTGDPNNKITMQGSPSPYINIGDILYLPSDSNGSEYIGSITNVEIFDEYWCISLSSDISINDDTDVFIFGEENKLGWYSYKIVVKQQKQDYYNVYTGSLLNGEPTSGIVYEYFEDEIKPVNLGASDEVAYIPLYSDNVNKIPADLAEVAPDQKLFRTSDSILYPRVGPNNNTRTNRITVDGKNIQLAANSCQYDFSRFVKASTLGKMKELSLQRLTGTITTFERVKGVSGANGSGYFDDGGIVGFVPGNNVRSVIDENGNISYEENACGTGVGASFCVDFDDDGDGRVTALSEGGIGYSVGDLVIAGNKNPQAQTVLCPPHQLCDGTSVDLDRNCDASGTNSGRITFPANSAPIVRVTGILQEDASPLNALGIFNSDQNPVIAKLSTYNNELGASAVTPTAPGVSCPFYITDFIISGGGLSVIEVDPPESRIEIFWETSSSGLVSDLNKAIKEGPDVEQIFPDDPPDTSPTDPIEPIEERFFFRSLSKCDPDSVPEEEG